MDGVVVGDQHTAVGKASAAWAWRGSDSELISAMSATSGIEMAAGHHHPSVTVINAAHARTNENVEFRADGPDHPPDGTD